MALQGGVSYAIYLGQSANYLQKSLDFKRLVWHRELIVWHLFWKHGGWGWLELFSAWDAVGVAAEKRERLHACTIRHENIT